MADRDVPSFPVTTLAGLTSLSDLLSELPIAECTQSSTNRSLLFHPRVAEEANNLLQTRDEQLASQLVSALQQTNSNNIELKDEYKRSSGEQQQQPNPSLLQVVHQIDPNVFQYQALQLQQQQQQEQSYIQQCQFIQQPPQPQQVKGYAATVGYVQQQPVAQAAQSSSQDYLQQQDFQQPQLFSPAAMVQQQLPGPSNVTNNIYQTPNNHIYPQQQPQQQQQQMWPQQQQQQTFNHQQPMLGNANVVGQQPPRNNDYLQQPQHKPSPAQASPAPETSQTFNNLKHGQNHRAITTNTVTPPKAANSRGGGPVKPGAQLPTTVGMLEALRNSNTIIQQGAENQVARVPVPTVTTPVKVDVEVSSMANEEIDITDLERFKLKMPVITVKPLATQDASVLQNDIKSFIKNEPEKAAELGVSDMFSKIKAEEDRRNLKRPAQQSIDEIVSKPKLRRVERKLAPVVQKMAPEELMKTTNYQRFMQFMNQILEELDETEAVVSLEDDDNADVIPTRLLTSISGECQKLKARNAIDALPENKLTLLISYAMRSVFVARNLSAGPEMQDEGDIDEAVPKILDAAEASLLVCNVYTCKSTKFLQEDNIDAIIKFVQFQLRETIFPSYDPVYTFETKKKVDKRKKENKHKSGTQIKEVSQLYHKLVELTKVLVQLYGKFNFVDTITIHASALGVEPFFVDNIEALQFVCLDLVTTIFQNERYATHRKNILAEILASVDRLPHTKRNLRPFKLSNNGGNIQMMTALVLQLIQCSVVLPEHFGVSEHDTSNNSKRAYSAVPKTVDKDTYIHGKYETAVSIGGNFLTTFLNKCKSRSSETDFRPLFENFIHDLLTTVNRPEWPAAELLLSLLGTLLLKYMSDKNIDQSIRVVSLEYLGIVASRLRKDTVESCAKVDVMDELIKMIKQEQQRESDAADKSVIMKLNAEEERTEFLQRILLDYLAVNAQEDNIIWSHAKHFYLTLWYRDIFKLKRQIRDGVKGYASRKKPMKRKKPAVSSDDDDDSVQSISDSEEENGRAAKNGNDEELNRQIFKALDERKKYLLSKINDSTGSSHESDDIKTYLDYNNAHLIAQYLASKRQFSQSFDLFLKKIILVVREPSIAIRTKAMKCLSNIVEVDHSILARKDMQLGVAQKLLDTAISVREAAVDLIGKYILSDIELVDQYYDMLSVRILDMGVSVRKRVIKILRDICIEFPAHKKIPDICVKMIRRVNDEEGIQKLVMEVFMTMWFTPCNDNDKDAMDRKITQIIDVVCSANEKGSSGLEDLLKIIFEPKENKDDAKAKKEIPKSLIKACQQIVDGLVNATISLEGSEKQNRLVGCITALHLFSKARPQMLVNHAETLEPYLNLKSNSRSLEQFISYIAEILEQVVPLMDHPSESFLNELEAHLLMLVFSNTQTTLISCISSLAAVVNKITKNYKLIRDCFKRFYYKSLLPTRRKLESTPDFPLAKVLNPAFRRSIFTVGLLTRHFDFKNPIVYGGDAEDALPSNICNEVFETFAFFFKCDNIDLRRQVLVALGHFCVQNYVFMTKSELRDVYLFLLSEPGVQNDIKIQVLKNILIYLTEEEQIMVRRDKDWQTQSKTEDLKEMGDVSSGMASAIIQVYLTEILNCFLHRIYQVRFWAMRVIEIVLRQGLIHPIKIVPYLICLSTDAEKEVAHSADRHLQEIDKQYPGFVNMKSHDGLNLSYQLQNVIQRTPTNSVVRGFRIKDKNEPPSALNGFLYSLLRNAKPTRRALIQSIVKQFDDQTSITLQQMLYLADNLVYFPYLVQDEPLYLIHQVDLLISNTGTNLLCNFREGLKPNPALANKSTELSDSLLDEDDDDDIDSLCERLPDDTTELERCITAAQGCNLLLIAKQQLKEIYGITDTKISSYTPSDTTKAFDKAMQRKSNSVFNPKATISILKEERNLNQPLDEKGRRLLVERYVEFKELMEKLDPAESESDLEDKLTANKVAKDTTSGSSRLLVNNVHSDSNLNANETQNNVSNAVETSVTPAKATPVVAVNKSTAKKQFITQRKRKKRKPSTSDESEYNSDDFD